MNKAVSVGPLLLSLLLMGCASKTPGEADITKVIESELSRQAESTPGARMELKNVKDLRSDCVQGATPDTSDLYSCTLSGTLVVRGYINDEPTTPDDKEAPLKGVMIFRKNNAGDWAVVSWEGA